MMSIAIDPAETRKVPAKRSAMPALRIVLLAGLGGIGLLGLSAGAYSMLSGLAGPQLSKATIGRTAADWPDLKDGVPALVAAPGALRPASSPVAAVSTDRLDPGGDVPARAPSLRTSPVGEASAKPVHTAAIPEPKRLPPIEKVTVLSSAKPVALVAVARTAALVAPLPAETVRARVAADTFAAPPPEAGARPAPAPVKKTATPIARAKAVPSSVQASAAPAAAASEAEETEVFGIKVPSLAPAGRKIVESVEALGNAVKSLSD